MSGALTSGKADNTMPGAHSSSVNQMKPPAGAFDHTAAVERSPFLQRVQRVMSSGTDISIKDSEAASDFVELVKESTTRARGPLIQILQASVKKQDKQVLQALVDHGLLVELFTWMQSLKESAQDSADDKANLITLCKVVSSLPVTPDDMRASKIGYVLTSLSKMEVDDIAAAATSTRDFLRDRMRSLKVPGGLSKRSIASVTAANANGSHATALASQTSESASDPSGAPAVEGLPQPQASDTSVDEPGSAFVAAGALQERIDEAAAPGTVPISFGGPPSAAADVAPTEAAVVDPGSLAPTAPVGNGALSRLHATIAGPARKASEVFANIKRSITSATSGAAAPGALAGGKPDSGGVMTRIRQAGVAGSRGRLGSITSGRTPLLTSAPAPPVLDIPDTASAAERAKLIGDAAERAYGANAETPAKKRRRLREAGKPVKRVQFREGGELERVQLFFSEEFPGFVHVQKRDGGGFVDSAGVDGGSSGFGASKQDVDDKHARFQESARREHLAERATNHVEHDFVSVDRKALARLHSSPNIKFLPVASPLPEGYACGEDSTELATRAAYCNANPVADAVSEQTVASETLSKQRVVVEDPPRSATNHWEQSLTTFGFQTTVSSANVQMLLKEQDEAMMRGAVKAVAPAQVYRAQVLARRGIVGAAAAAAGQPVQPENTAPPAQPDLPMHVDIHRPQLPHGTHVLSEAVHVGNGLSAPPPDVQAAFSVGIDAGAAPLPGPQQVMVPVNGMQPQAPSGITAAHATGAVHGTVSLAGSAGQHVGGIPISNGAGVIWLQPGVQQPITQVAAGCSDDIVAGHAAAAGMHAASDATSGFQPGQPPLYHRLQGRARSPTAVAAGGDAAKRPRMGESRLAGGLESSGSGHGVVDPAIEHDYGSRKRFKEDSGSDLRRDGGYDRHSGHAEGRRWDRDGGGLDSDGAEDLEDLRATRSRHERVRERGARQVVGGGYSRDREDDIADAAERHGGDGRDRHRERDRRGEDDERGWDRERGDVDRGERRERGGRGKGRGARGGGRGTRGGRVCAFWNSPSGCYQGDECKFLHEGEGRCQPKPEWFREKQTRGRGRGGRGGRDRSDSP